MGKLPGGIDYDIIGRVGNHVGRKVKGENILSMRPSKSNKAATELQLIQRAKFGFLTSWLAEIGTVINLGFKNYDADMSARNACMSYNWAQGAVTGVAPNFTIDYPKLRLSSGMLMKPYLPNVATGSGISVEFAWELNIGSGNAKATDKFSFVVYDPILKEYAFVMGIAMRSALSYEMMLPADFSGHNVQAWVVVASEDGKLVSDSVHLGPVAVG